MKGKSAEEAKQELRTTTKLNDAEILKILPHKVSEGGGYIPF